MADINSGSWSEADASNNGASPAGFPEGMNPSGVNDSARAVMGAIKRWRNQVGPTVTSGGSANAQTLTYSVSRTAYVAGDEFVFLAGFTNTGPATLNVDGLGAVAILAREGAALSGREIQAGQITRVYYDGTQFTLPDVGDQTISTTNGTVYLAGGLIMKFGVVTFTANTTTVNFATAFPNGTLFAGLGPVGNAGSTHTAYVGSLTNSALVINLDVVLAETVYWFVLGY